MLYRFILYSSTIVAVSYQHPRITAVTNTHFFRKCQIQFLFFFLRAFQEKHLRKLILKRKRTVNSIKISLQAMNFSSRLFTLSLSLPQHNVRLNQGERDLQQCQTHSIGLLYAQLSCLCVRRVCSGRGISAYFSFSALATSQESILF